MSSNGAVVQFQSVNTGDLSDIPPDLPAGEWQATCAVKKLATSKDKYPMLALEWKTTEANTDGNEEAVGGRVTDFIVFYPANHRASRMGKLRLKEVCEALDIEIPTIKAVKSWDDLADLIDALEGTSAVIYTTVEADKTTGEQRSKIRYSAPGALKTKSKMAAEEDDEDSDEEEEKAPVIKKKLKKKIRS